jgi:hypothetical protein
VSGLDWAAVAVLLLITLVLLVVLRRLFRPQYPLRMSGDAYGAWVADTPFGTVMAWQARDGWLVVDSWSVPPVPVRAESQEGVQRVIAQMVDREQLRRDMLPG